MKKINIVAILAASLLVSSAFAQKKKSSEESGKAKKSSSKSYSREYGMAGCGLGSIVMGKKGAQILASTTNGTAYNQLFAITFGTSNCVDGPNDDVAKKMDNFIETNKAVVAVDISRGQGETINAIASILGCSDQEALGSALKREFSSIYPTFNINSNEVTDSVITVIMNEKNVSCTNVHLG